MNPYYDVNVSKYWKLKWWHRLYLWLWPTYVSFDDMTVVHWKKVKGVIYVTKIEMAPYMRMDNDNIDY